MHLEKGTIVMKKALYGTTALVAAAVVAGQADAASGLKLGITGFYRGAMGGTFGTDNEIAPSVPGINGGFGTGLDGRNNFAFRQEVRVNFTGSTTLDNGITVGVLVGINAGGGNNVTSNSTTRTNRAYMDLSGKFGQIRFGDANSAYQSMCVGDPGNVTANFGLNSPNETFTPDHVRSAGGSGGNGGTFGVGAPTHSGAAFHDFLSAGVNFNHDFGGVTLSAGVSGEWALAGKTTNSTNANSIPHKPSMYQAGFQLGFGGGWAVGASGQYVINYTHAGYANPTFGGVTPGLATSSDDAYMITAGGSYTIDAVSIGLEGLFNNYSTSNADGHVRYEGVSLNAAYALGPGISLEGQVAWTRSSDNFDTGGLTDFNN